MSRDSCVHTWPCSYYLELEKRWIPGKLSLTSLSLKFMTDKTGDTLVNFPLSSIIEIKKEASQFIFSSLTILEKDHVKHWFSSLQPGRNVVFHVIEHFWRELLLSQPGAALDASSSHVTKGQELTGLMACSQKRLEDAATVLHHQGEQLDSIASGLDRIECDLDVADRLLTELESPSWWPFSSKLWKMPSDTKPSVDSSMASSKALGKEGIVIRVPAVIFQRTDSHVKPGSLTVLVSGLEIHDSSSSLIHRFEKQDVDDIKVHTHYEVSIRQRFTGKPDIAFRLISAKMPEVIPILEMQFSKKIELLEDDLMLRSARTSSPEEKDYSVWHADPEEAEGSCLGCPDGAGETGRGPGWHFHRRGPDNHNHRQAESTNEETDLEGQECAEPSRSRKSICQIELVTGVQSTETYLFKPAVSRQLRRKGQEPDENKNSHGPLLPILVLTDTHLLLPPRCTDSTPSLLPPRCTDSTPSLLPPRCTDSTPLLPPRCTDSTPSLLRPGALTPLPQWHI